MRDNVNFVLFVIAITVISLIPPFYLLREQNKNTATLPIDNIKILGIETQRNKNLPMRLVIPTINVKAIVQSVGVNSDGEMSAPDNTTDVGWFNLGPKPGQNGSAVIAGHFNGVNGERGVFANLDNLKIGDLIFIEDTGGTTTTFIVRKSRTFDPGYADEVFGSNGGGHLNLVTCDGIWDKTKKTFSKRLVVFADLIN